MSYSKELQDIIDKFLYLIKRTHRPFTADIEMAKECARIYLKGIIASNPCALYTERGALFAQNTSTKTDSTNTGRQYWLSNTEHFEELLNELNNGKD